MPTVCVVVVCEDVLLSAPDDLEDRRNCILDVEGPDSFLLVDLAPSSLEAIREVLTELLSVVAGMVTEVGTSPDKLVTIPLGDEGIVETGFFLIEIRFLTVVGTSALLATSKRQSS